MAKTNNTRLFFCFLLLMGCKNSTIQEKNDEIVSLSQTPMIIDIERNIDKDKEFRLSEIADDIEYVKLEKTSESFIGGGTPIWYLTKEYIFIYNSNRLLQFNRNGKYIKQIGNHGRGPGEFRSILGIVLNEMNKTLYIIANFDYKVLTYNVNTGEFLGDFPIHRYLGTAMVRRPFQMIKQDTFVALSDPQPQFTSDFELYEIFDSKGNVITKRKSFRFSGQNDDKKLNRKKEAINQIWSFNGNIRFFEDLSDTIYNLEYNKLNPAYIINLGKYKGSFDFMTTNNLRESRNNYLRLFDFWETKNLLFFRFYYQGKSYKGQFNKTNKDFYKLLETKNNANRLYNDIDGGLPFWPWYAVEDDEWVCCFDAINFKKQLSGDWFQTSEAMYSEKREHLKKFVDELLIDDNPVLMIVKLK